MIAVGLAVGWPLTAATPLAFDDAILARLSTSTEPEELALARWIGHLGHLAVVTPIVIAVCIEARRRTRTWDLGWFLLVVFGGATTITTVLKFATARARPDGALLSTFTSAFPSGHAVRAAAVFGLLAWLAFRWSRRASVGGVAVALAVALVAVNGVARVVLAVHWPTDVLAGAVIGAAWLVLSVAVLRPRLTPSAPAGDAPSRR